MEIENQRADQNSHSDPLFRNMTQQQPFKKPGLPHNPMSGAKPTPESTGNLDRWVLALESAGVTDPSRKLLQQRRINHQKRLKAALKQNKKHKYAAAPANSNFSSAFDGVDVIVIDDEDKEIVVIDDEDLSCHGKMWNSSDEDRASISDQSDLTADQTDELGVFLHTRGISEDVKNYSRDEVFQLSSVEEVCSILG